MSTYTERVSRPSDQHVESYLEVVGEAEDIVLRAEAANLKFDIKSQITRKKAVQAKPAAEVAHFAYSGNIFAQRELPNIVGRHRAEGSSTAEQVLSERTAREKLATETVRATVPAGRHLALPTTVLSELTQLLTATEATPAQMAHAFRSALNESGLGPDYLRMLTTRLTLRGGQ